MDVHFSILRYSSTFTGKSLGPLKKKESSSEKDGYFL